ncbi:hypothetical protein [Adhaeretor mobilis]|nr:hypothetical protein [Adhaeretor mobilis]
MIRSNKFRLNRVKRIDGKLLRAVLLGCLFVSPSAADQPTAGHWLHSSAMPPGAIGRQRLARGGAVHGYCQPVEIRAPQGVRIAPAVGSSFAGSADMAYAERLKVGLRIGPVYRFQVSGLKDQPEVELFPTIELVDRLHPPQGKALKFPVPVDLTAEELQLASEGKFITRVIYVEDPHTAVPILQRAERGTNWAEARPGEDLLLAAKAVGRPIAILRMGGRTPETSGYDPAFTYNAPRPLVYNAWSTGLESGGMESNPSGNLAR